MNAGTDAALALGILLAGAALTLAAGRGRRRLAAGVAIGSGLVALALAVVGQFAPGGSWRARFVLPDLPGLVAGGRIEGGGPAGFLFVVVLAVTWAVQVFAAWYLADDDRYPVFAATVGLFAAAMALLVVAQDLVLVLIGWEVMGWCSYLLIGHWSRKETARRAAHKAFLVTRLADIGMVTGIVVLVATFGTTDLARILDIALNPVSSQTCNGCTAPSGPISFAMTAIVIGVLGKSAQLPFQDWLTDAMEGPTPASALIHAATMVAAGTWVLARLSGLLATSAIALWVLTVSVAATMVLAAYAAFLQPDLKRLLAWSTISQIGVMLAPLAALPLGGAQRLPPSPLGRPSVLAATGHLYSHAIFKALLFLTIGWLSVLAGSTAARALQGSVRGRPLAHAAWAIGLASLAGVPLTVGGFSKEHVIAAVTDDAAGARRGLLAVALLLTVALTAAYCARAYAVATVAPTPATGGLDATPGHGSASGQDLPSGHATAPGWPVQAVLGLLALAALLGGLSFYAGPLRQHGFSLAVLGLTVALLLAGAIIGWYSRPDDRLDPSPAMLAAASGFGTDRAYLAVIARPVLALARGAAYLDREVIDVYVRGAAGGARALGTRGTRIHGRERVATNLVWVIVGLLALAGVALWR